MASHQNFLTEAPHLVQRAPWPDVKMTQRWSSSLWLIYELLLSICHQPATPFWHFKTDVCHSPLPTCYISVRSHTVCQLAWQNVWSTRTKLFHFTACRLWLLRNVHLPPFFCVSFAPAQVFTPSSWPAPGLSPLYRWRPGCVSHATSPVSLPSLSPWFHAAATELFPGLPLLLCSHLSKGFCTCLTLRESDSLLYPGHLPHLVQGSPPLQRIHWLFCWSQTVTH